VANLRPIGQDRDKVGADRDDAADARDVAAQARDEAADRRDDDSTAPHEYVGVIVDDLHAIAGQLRRCVRDHLARIEKTTSEIPRDLDDQALTYLRAHGAEQRELIDAGREAIMALLDEIDEEIRHDRTELARLTRDRLAAARDRADSASDRSAAAHDRAESSQYREQATIEREQRRPPDPLPYDQQAPPDTEDDPHHEMLRSTRERIHDSRERLARAHRLDSPPAANEGA